MSQSWKVTSSPSVFVTVGDFEQMTVRNFGPNTVYYDETDRVSSSVNNGSIASGATADVGTGLYFAAATSGSAQALLAVSPVETTTTTTTTTTTATTVHPLFGSSIPVCSNTRTPALDRYGDGVGETETEGIYRTWHRLVCTATAFRVVYANVVNNSPANADQITVQASFDTSEYSTPVRFTFDGENSVVIDPGGVVISDPVDLRMIGASSFFIRTHVEVAADTLDWPFNLILSQTGEGRDLGSGAEAKLLADTVTATTGEFAYGPSAILATPADGETVVVVGAAGDSTVESADTNSAGFIQRAFNSAPFQTGAPFAAVVQTSLGGDGMTSLTTGGGTLHWKFLSLCDYVFNHYGINDINGTASLATMQTRILSACTNIADRGALAVQTTIGPSGAYSAGEETTRGTVNTWIRAGAPIDPTLLTAVAIGTSGALTAGSTGHPISLVIDTAAVLDADAGLLDDGTHPNPAGHIALAAVIDMEDFGL